MKHIKTPAQSGWDRFLLNGKRVSCIDAVQDTRFSLFGQGILVAVIDSGVDYFHPDFRNDDGTTRILAMWDQTGVWTGAEENVENAGNTRLVGGELDRISGQEVAVFAGTENREAKRVKTAGEKVKAWIMGMKRE